VSDDLHAAVRLGDQFQSFSGVVSKLEFVLQSTQEQPEAPKPWRMVHPHVNMYTTSLVVWRLGCLNWNCNRKVVGSTTGRVSVK